MAYYGYIVQVTDIRKHSNADRLQIATFFGNDVIVDMSVKPGEMGIYFPSDGQLSEEYCAYNGLVECKNSEGKNVGGYLDPVKRNVKAIKLRGEKSDGLYMPLYSLDYLDYCLDYSEFKVGDRIDIIDGHEICRKYIPRSNKKNGPKNLGNKTRKRKLPIAPLFVEHADTEQLDYNLGAFKEGDLIEITLKMHGTSQRTAYLPVLKGYHKTLLDKLLHREGTPIYDWGYVSGTRRTIIDNERYDDSGFYGTNAFREQHARQFEGKLLKGEEVYYEVVGYITRDIPVMHVGRNEKLGKDFVKKYGETTTFSYGCEPGYSKSYVYRMTMTNEDGDIVEYDPEYMRYRCEQMGVEVVPVLDRFFIPEGPRQKNSTFDISPGEYVKEIAEEYYDGPDPIGKTHIREGVVCRIVNRPRFCAYKLKNFSFKVLEGLIKEADTAPDIEEAQEVLNE